MTEIEAAIGIEQLKKLDILIEQRIKNVEIIESGLSQIEGLTMPSKGFYDKTRVLCARFINDDSSKFENVHLEIDL